MYYTPLYVVGVAHTEYIPVAYLESRYSLLSKYNLLQLLDDMVWKGSIEIQRYLEILAQQEDAYMEEFMEGTPIELLDMLKGDVSELAPILYDRVRLRFKYENNLTISDIFQTFVHNYFMRDVLFRNYFNFNGEGGTL